MYGIVSHYRLGNVRRSRLFLAQTFKTLAFHIFQCQIVTINVANFLVMRLYLVAQVAEKLYLKGVKHIGETNSRAEIFIFIKLLIVLSNTIPCFL